MEETKIPRNKVNSLKLDVNKLGIEEGVTFTNYKYMCKRLGLEVTPVKGNSRKAQELEIRRYFDYEKIEGTQKLYVTEVYPEPLTREDRRKTDEAKQLYIKEQEIIMLFFANQISKAMEENDSIDTDDLGYIIWDVTTRDYWRAVGMINENFGTINVSQLNDEYLKDNEDLYVLNQLNMLDNKYKITPKKLNDFYMRAGHKLSQIMKSALKNLTNRAVIFATKEFKIITTDEDGNCEYHMANNDEKSKILEAKRIAMNSMGYSYQSEIFVRDLKEKFYAKINEVVHEKYGWDSIYEYNHILFNRNNVLLEITDLERSGSMYSLNKKIVEYLNDSIEKTIKSKNNKALELYNQYVKENRENGKQSGNFYEFVNDNNLFVYDNEYIEQQHFICNKVIKLKN